jgi:hypothetical protein
LLQGNCRSVYEKAVEFWNSFTMYRPDVVLDTESWHKEGINNAEAFSSDFTALRKDRTACGAGSFIRVKIITASKEIRVND